MARCSIDQNPFKREIGKVYHRPDGWSMLSIVDQKRRLKRAFDGIDLSSVDKILSDVIIPASADDVALIPKLSYLGSFWNIENPYDTGYGKAVRNAVEFVSRFWMLHKDWDNATDESYFRLHEQVIPLLKTKENATSGDVMVLPFSCGNLYAGFSVRNARWEALHNAQLPLGSAQVAFLLSGMFGCLDAFKNWIIYCPADEHNWNGDGQWGSCSYFQFYHEKLEFRATSINYTDGGPVMAFL